LRLSPSEWRELLRWFVRGAPSAEIARETGLERKRVLRALLVVRRALAGSAPIGQRTTPPHSTTRVATLGLHIAEDGHAWAELVSDAESEQFGRRLRDRGGARSITATGLVRYTAIVYRGRLYRLAGAGAERVPFGRVEAFWAYLQRHLRAKGGVRRERMDLYLAAFAWRYNHRKLSPAEQVARLLALIRQV
jgi:predicted nucleic acid-binding protein